MKKRLALGCLTVFCLVLVFIHTQPVERLIFRQIQSRLAKLGWQLQAKQFDLNLFALSVTIRDLRLTGPGTQAQFKHLHLNASAGILLGKLSMDQVHVGQGMLRIDPQASPPEAGPTGPINLPDIYLGQATFEKVVVNFQDQSRELNFSLQDIGVVYRDQQLKARLVTPETLVQGRTLPAFSGQLQLGTDRFQSFHDISLKIESSQSYLHLSGYIDAHLNPNLAWSAKIGADLLPEHPNTQLTGAIDEREFEIHLENMLTVGDQAKRWTMDSRFDYRVDEPHALIQLRIEDLLQGSSWVHFEEKQIRGGINVQGQPNGINALVPQLNIGEAQIEGEWQMLDMDPTHLVAHAQLRMMGEPSFSLTLDYQEQTLRFNGMAQSEVGATLTLQGRLKETLELSFLGTLPQINSMDAYVKLPQDVYSGPIQVSGTLRSDFEDYYLENMQLNITQMGYANYFEDDVQLTVNGPLQALQGSLICNQLQPDKPTIEFSLDALNQHWHDLTIDINSTSQINDTFQYRVAFQANGKGTLLAPAMAGEIQASLNKDQGAVGALSNSFTFADQVLTIPDLNISTHHGDLMGYLDLNMEQWLWNSDLRLTGREHGKWLPLTNEQIPRFVFHLAGDQKQMDGRLTLPQQSVQLGGFTFPIQPDDPLEIQSRPDREQAQGHLPSIEIAGINLSDLQFALDQGQIKLESSFGVKDPAKIKAILAKHWPEGLELIALSGQFEATSDLSFANPNIQLSLNRLHSSYQDAPLILDDLALSWVNGQLRMNATKGEFAGIHFKLASTPNPSKSEPSAPLQPLDFTLFFETKQPENLAIFFKEQWPEGFELGTLRGNVRLQSDWQLQNPMLDFTIEQFQAIYNDQPIIAKQISGRYDQELRLSPGEIQVGDLDIQIIRVKRGMAIETQPDMAFISQWVPHMVGDAQFDVGIIWDPNGDGFQAHIKQISGRLIYPEPWLEVASLDLRIHEASPHIFKLEQGTATVNGQSLNFSGILDWRGAQPDLTLTGDIENLHLAFADYQVSLTTVLEWRFNEKINQLTGTVALKDGYFSPKIEVEGLVQELLSPIPAIYFPDPLLEQVKLQLVILTESPLVVEHELGYWELETPTLIIGGDLASPIPQSGSLNINEGSLLRQGRNTFLFQNSQIQFHPNRLGDPYLQIAMVEASNSEEKQPIYFTGYISEFDQNLDNQDITTFLLTILLGQVTSLVSFEIQISDSLTESSFITWVSRRLTDKVVVRYAIPLNGQESLLEVKLGPFWRNFINMAEEENRYATAIRHAMRFGFLNKPPETVKQIEFESRNWPKNLKRKFKLKRGDTYSATRARFAVFDLKRRLKMQGYLHPKIQSSYANRIFRIEVDPGPRFELAIEGLVISDDEKRQLFLGMQGDSQTSVRHLELLVERLAIAKGHPSAAAFAEFKDDRIDINVYVSHTIGKIQFNFGEAQDLLGGLYESEEETQRFMIKYFISASDAESELRARLAAKGFVRPKIANAEFPTPTSCRIAIDPGPRAQLFMLVVNGTKVDIPLLGQPFEYSFIAATALTLAEPESGKKFQIRLTPRREDEHIFFDVKKTPVEDQRIESLAVNGAGRIPDKKIRSFLGFRKAMPQSKLMKNQERLIETGSFTLARLRTTGQSALLEVRERNRWDIDYEVSYDKVSDIGVGIQFRDRMLFRGFNPLGLAIRRNRIEEEFVARQEFLRAFGSPIDLFVGLRWNNERIDLHPDQSEPLFDTVFITKRPRETIEFNGGLSYKLFEHQLLTAGITWEQIVTRQFEEVFFFDENNNLVPDPTLPPARLADLKVNRVPLRTSWLFSNLDNELYPKNGIFSQVSYEYFPRALGTNGILSGWRALGKFNSFLTRGRWRWWQRIEAGLYQRELTIANILEDEADNNLFFLGGPKSIRGFGYQLVGPLRKVGDTNLVAQGGQAMVIFTQELNYDLNFYGLGISPFLDGGWVWRDRADFLEDGILISGGLGLTLETPIGRFRLDWANPLDDRPFERTLDQIFANDPAARAKAKDQVLDEISIRFGRVF